MPEEVKAVCADMFLDMQVTEPDAELSDDGLRATIPYYSHGRMNAHTIDLEMMAKSALIIARSQNP